MRVLAFQSAETSHGFVNADPSQSVNALVVHRIAVQCIEQLRIIVLRIHEDIIPACLLEGHIRIVDIVAGVIVAVLSAVEGTSLRNGSSLDLLAVEIIQVSLDDKVTAGVLCIDLVHDNIGSSGGRLGAADDVAVGVEVEREVLTIVGKHHRIIFAQDEAASAGVLGAVDGDRLSISRVRSTSQLASLGISSSNDGSRSGILAVAPRVVGSIVGRFILLQGQVDQNLGANCIVNSGDSLDLSSLGIRLIRSVGRIVVESSSFFSILHPNIDRCRFRSCVAVLVVLGDRLNFGEEGVDNGDDVAVLSLEDLSQVALAAELSVRPLGAANVLASLVPVMYQRDIRELEAINCEVVQSGVGNKLAIDLQLGSRGTLRRVGLVVTVQRNRSLGGLTDADIILQDGASGNSSGVAVDRLVHVECGPGTVAPVVARTTELIGSTLDGDAHLAAEGVAGLGNLLVGDESGLVVLASGVVVVLDQLAVLNQIAGQCVVEDLGSFAALDGGNSLPAVLQTSGQADLIGAVQDVDVPAGAGVAFLGGVEVQGGEHQLQELNASDLTLRGVGGGGHAVSQAGDTAVVDVGQSPAGVAVDERVLCVAVQIGDVGLDPAVGSRVVDDGHDLGCLRTGQSAVSLEGLIFETVKDLQAGQGVDSVGVVLERFGIGILVGLCASDGDDAHDHDDGQDQRKNLLQILHLDFLLFKFYTSGRGPLCNLYLHFTAREPGSQEGGGVCNLIVTLGG